MPYELYTAAQVRELDRRMIEQCGTAGYTLMSRAGQAAFETAIAAWPAARRIAVVAGTGNNGGDGFIFARLAHAAGRDVVVALVGESARLKGDAAAAADAMRKAGLDFHPFHVSQLQGVDLVVDALFGIGLDREVTGHWRVAIEAINGAGAPVLAIDIPSGLHADSGAILGAAVSADVTLTFIGLKRGLFTGDGPGYCGRVVFDDLGAPPHVYRDIGATTRRIDGGERSRLLQRRRRSSHKGLYGRLLVIGGDHGMGGAVRMAGEAAARVGAGLVSVATRAANILTVTAGRPELICYGIDDVRSLAPLLECVDAVAIGPGLGQSAWGGEMLACALAAGRPMVVDADGLNLLANAPIFRDDWILTPHPAEASRLLGITTHEVQQDRFRAVLELRRRYGGTVILKGAGSVVQGPTGAALCSAGNPGMASAGMGDILTGTVAGLFAQALKQGLPAEEAARLGVALHGRAGDLAAADGERGLLATDLLPHLRRLVNPS